MPSNEVETLKVDNYEEPTFREPSVDSILFNTNCMKGLAESASEFHPFMTSVEAMSIHPDSSSPFCDDLPLSKDIDPESDEAEKENLKILNKMKGKYGDLIRQYPDILKTSFKKGLSEGTYINMVMEWQVQC